VSRFGPQRVHHVTLADTVPCVANKRWIRDVPPQGSTIAK
jgi:hypothetical protein